MVVEVVELEWWCQWSAIYPPAFDESVVLLKSGNDVTAGQMAVVAGSSDGDGFGGGTMPNARLSENDITAGQVAVVVEHLSWLWGDVVTLMSRVKSGKDFLADSSCRLEGIIQYIRYISDATHSISGTPHTQRYWEGGAAIECGL